MQNIFNLVTSSDSRPPFFEKKVHLLQYILYASLLQIKKKMRLEDFFKEGWKTWKCLKTKEVCYFRSSKFSLTGVVPLLSVLSLKYNVIVIYMDLSYIDVVTEGLYRMARASLSVKTRCKSTCLRPLSRHKYLT